ncbi:MAG: putative phage repressor [Actinomycetia bacterium]|nr:putative phage repressor [Actinomycetes bacterium]
MRRPLMAVEVAGDSMLPALRPGDRLLVRPGARIGAGDIVIARHPLQPGRLIVKRVTHRAGDGWWLESDNQRASGRQDSWDFGAVPDRFILGRAVVRYWPSISASAFSRRRVR